MLLLSRNILSSRASCLKNTTLTGTWNNDYRPCYSTYRKIEKPIRITYCDLAFSGLNGIPINIPNHPDLRLDLRYNGIMTVRPGKLSHINKTIEICFDRNRIGRIQNGSFLGLSSLKILSLRKNKLSEIYAAMWNGLDQLQELNLADNKIKHIGRSAFSSLQNLLRLNMESNLLKHVANNSGYWGSLPKLLELNLGTNNIKYIGIKAFSGLKNLLVLQIAENKLVQVNQQAFSGLLQLRELFISNVKKTVLHGILTDLSNISDLHVDHSQLFHLDGKLFPLLQNLRRLFLHKGQIRNIEEGTFLNQRKLIRLSLPRNKLTNISSGMWKGLAQLEILSLSYNKIQLTNKEPFLHLQSLKELDLSSNRVSKLRSSTWKGLGRLLRLYLSHNLIRKIGEKVFVFLKNCIFIDLRHNRIVSIEQSALDGLKRLLEFDARYNPIKSIDSNILEEKFRNKTGKAFYLDLKTEMNTCNFCLCQVRDAPMNVTLVLKHPIEYKHRHYREDYSTNEYNYFSKCCPLGYTWENLLRCEKYSYFRCRLQISDFDLSSCGSNHMSKSKSVAHSNYTKGLNNTRALKKKKTKHKLKNIRKHKQKISAQRTSHNNTHLRETQNQPDKAKGQGPDFVTVCIIAISGIVVICIAGFIVKTLYARYRLLATIQQNDEYEINDNVGEHSKEDSAQSDSCHEDIF